MRDPSERHVGSITALLEIDGGRQVVSAGTDATLRRWTSAGGWLETIDLFEEHSEIRACTADSSAPLIIAGSDGGWIAVWRGPDAPQSSWKAHLGAVTGLELLPDAQHYLSAGEDGLLKLWDVSQEQPVVQYNVASPILRLWYDSQSQRAMVCDRAGSLHIIEFLGVFVAP